jgi:DNA gyrase subunit B
MDPETRTMLRVTAEDFTDTGGDSQIFSTLMGDDVPERRAFIEKYAQEVTNLDV